MLTDSFYTTQAMMIAEAMAARGEDVRLYHFTQKPEGEAGEVLGAFHASELPYVGIASPHYLGPVNNAILADYMSSYWTNFAKTGDPSGDGLPEWESMPASAEEWFVLGPEVGPKPIPKEKLDLFKPIIPDYINGPEKFNAAHS